MIYSKKATSIIEAMVVMLVVVSGIIGMYKIYTQSIKLSNSTANKIQAIQIAREGIEAMTNIRDTNWLIFLSDNKNCWNVVNYNSNCIGDNGFSTDFGNNKSYTISSNPTTHRWEVSDAYVGDFSEVSYNTQNRVGLDNDGFYTQSGATLELKPVFTRVITTEYIDTDNSGDTDSNDEKIKVTSLVQWKDNAKNTPHEIKLSTILSNWKR